MTQQSDLVDFTYSADRTTWAFFGLATLIFGLRTMSRLCFTNKVPLGWDDLFITLSWPMALVRAISYQLALSAFRRIDFNNPATQPQTIPTATFWALFTATWSCLSIPLPKIGVAFLLVRIFRPKQSVRGLLIGSSIVITVLGAVLFIICFVQCDPVPGQWNPFKYPDAHCWPRDVQIDFALFTSACSAFLDLAFAAYPGFVIMSLQMPLWKKLSTMALMCLGLAAFATGLVKVISNSTLLGNPNLTQLYTDAFHIGYWNSIENDIIIIAACLPVVPPVLLALNRKIKSQVTKSSFTTLRSGPVVASGYEMSSNRQPSLATAQDIHVKQNFVLEQESAEPADKKTKPQYNFQSF